MAELVGELLVHAAVSGAEAVSRSVSEGRERREGARRERALAMADIVVLAAFHDFVVTGPERRQLGEELREKAGVELSVEEMLERWASYRAALDTEAAFRVAVRSLAADLDSDERRQAFEAAVRVLSAAGDEAGSGPFRRQPERTPAVAIAALGEGLGIPPDVIRAAS